MRHDPTFHLRDGHPVAISHCSCGWIPSSHPPDTDEQFATHVAAAMLDHQGLGQAEIARRAEALAGWVTYRLVEGVEYRERYGEASYSASGHYAAAVSISTAVCLLTGGSVPKITDAELDELRRLNADHLWESEQTNRVGDLLPKLLAEFDRLREEKK